MPGGHPVKVTNVLSECHAEGTPLLSRLLDHFRAFFLNDLSSLVGDYASWRTARIICHSRAAPSQSGTKA